MSNKITTIQLIGDVEGYLDIAPETAFPLNFAIGDIRDISKKTGTSSKSITLTGSKNNNTLLNYYFDLNILAGTFNINTLQQCIVVQNGVVIMDNAVMQLVEINKSQENGNHDEIIGYTVLLKDSTGDFFTVINNRLLTDLDFSDLNHIYTADNVIASFNNTVSDGYKFLMPYDSSVSGDTAFNLEEFQPAIYAKKYLDNIFAKAGFGYRWPGSTGSTVQFEKLIIPYNGDAIKVTPDILATLLVEAESTTTQSFTSTAPTGSYGSIPNASTFQKINIITEITDPNGNYTPASSTYTAPSLFNTALKYSYDISYQIVLINNSGGVAYVESTDPGAVNKRGIKIRPLLKTNGQTEYLLGPVNQEYFLNDNLSIPVGTTVVNAGTTTVNRQFNSVAGGTTFQLALNTFIYGFNTLGNGQSYGFYTSTSRAALADVDISIRITGVQLRIQPQVTNFGFNVPLTMNNFIPKQIKQSDFVKSIFTMYNIFPQVDPTNSALINLVQRDEFYDSGSVVDWTKKLAKDKNQVVQFIPELNTKKIVLTYKEDKDLVNTTYVQATSEIYGQLEYTFDNEYVKGKTNQEIIFSPTPVTNTEFGAVLPMLSGYAPKTNIRILFDGGALPCSTYTIKNYAGNVVNGTTYPHLSHWNSPTNPTLDLNFGVCDYYFRDDDYGADTNNTLFNLNWRRTFNQINNGKMLIAYFNLSEYDIQKMRLNDKIRIDNSWWNINKVIDYNANASQLTKVELISIDEDINIPYIKKVVIVGKPGKPIKWKPTKEIVSVKHNYGNEIFTPHKVPVNGINNTLDTKVKFGSVFGDNNLVKNRSLSILGSNNDIETTGLVVGDNNVSVGGIEKAYIFGNGITADTEDTLYVNNIKVFDTVYLGDCNINSWGDPTRTSFYITDGGFNEVMRVSKINDMDKIDGGFNHVRNFGGDSKYRPIIDGGLD